MARRDSIDIGELTDPAFYILLSVMDEKHGYLIMKTIAELTNNKVTIGPASLYTTLKKILVAELVELHITNDTKKTYKITQKGYDMLKDEVERKKEMIKLAECFLNN
ncbi:PadR family transcriptional regulator (plasmid) [Clostridium estertheticum]|uniref:PadR family transcriptional regulator n=1 Tax=Clostridium estertheticum TaxID=238834 RepID=UPI001C7D9382|nr:PadR family transcriptional regulator [Clostridium estertheticum]MBX4262545.1 PadR family transcriptional regulator [Clostridium estertheticum]WLC73339.1 PadR family transcriptional regulator [Clostridium estertheticum]